MLPAQGEGRIDEKEDSARRPHNGKGPTKAELQKRRDRKSSKGKGYRGGRGKRNDRLQPRGERGSLEESRGKV